MTDITPTLYIKLTARNDHSFQSIKYWMFTKMVGIDQSCTVQCSLIRMILIGSQKNKLNINICAITVEIMTSKTMKPRKV